MAKTKSRLRTKLLFQYDTRSKNTDGFETPSWTDKGERYCQVDILRGREYWDAHAVLGSQGVIVRAHYDSTIAEVEPDRWRICFFFRFRFLRNVMGFVGAHPFFILLIFEYF